MAKFYNSKYINKTTVRDYNAFATEYFSGTDITVEINGKKTEVAAIDYTLQEQLKPIYGYASRVFDDVAVGSRIVVGSMVLPIKDTANHPEFKCSTKTKGDTPDSFAIGYDEGVENERKRHSKNLEGKETFKERKVTYDGVELYLSPFYNDSFLKVDCKVNCVVLDELKNHVYVYIKSLDIFGYIKKGV